MAVAAFSLRGRSFVRPGSAHQPWRPWCLISSVFCILVCLAPDIALAGPFDRAPRQFSALVNRSLTEVGSDLRFTLERCSANDVVECKFSSKHVSVRVFGTPGPASTRTISLQADLLQEEPGADPATVITDTVLALGATVVVYDPQIKAQSRVELLSNLTNKALDQGKSEARGLDAVYSAVFDANADGILEIVVSPLR